MTVAAFMMWASLAFTAPATVCVDYDACAWEDAAEHDTADIKSSAPTECEED